MDTNKNFIVSFMENYTGDEHTATPHRLFNLFILLNGVGFFICFVKDLLAGFPLVVYGLYLLWSVLSIILFYISHDLKRFRPALTGYFVMAYANLTHIWFFTGGWNGPFAMIMVIFLVYMVFIVSERYLLLFITFSIVFAVVLSFLKPFPFAYFSRWAYFELYFSFFFTTVAIYLCGAALQYTYLKEKEKTMVKNQETIEGRETFSFFRLLVKFAAKSPAK